MANLKPHIKLNSQKQREETVSVKFNYGFGKKEDEEEDTPVEPDYRNTLATFRKSLNRFYNDFNTKRKERNDRLQIPSHIDYINILFQDQFNIEKFYQSWYSDFGLLGVNFSQFNCVVLFAVINTEKFNSFLKDIQNFILKESGENSNVEYRGKVKFIKDFKLLTKEDILKFEDHVELMNFHLVDFPIDREAAIQIFKSLSEYLKQNKIEHRLIEGSNNLEVYGVSKDITDEIVKNFDIVISVTSSLSTVVRPSELNTVERTYGFDISNPDENLPVIGILDTGICYNTPLASLLIDDDTFNLTSTSPFIDNANNGLGHGTSVAALAAMGRNPYKTDYRGAITADAKLLSMKILDANSGFLSELDILNMLHSAKIKYPNIKLFVLTTCYNSCKSTNEANSTYAYELDRFAHENDCLIFICTSNFDASNRNHYDLNSFLDESTNICSPAESMNNVIVGAAADNLVGGPFLGISNGKEFPTLYTRKSHIDLSNLFPKNKQNKNLFRPDIIECGGDYEKGKWGIGTGERATMEVLSADPTRSFYKHAGTSFSAPLVANIAAKIQRYYPNLKAQTIKALIINAASLEAIRIEKPLVFLQNKIAGHGIVDPIRCSTSNENEVTFIIEDEIQPDEMKIIPINFPHYLINEDLGKKRGLLNLTATLCFSFEPTLNNHLGYCPIQIAFNIFRNQSGVDILKPEKNCDGGVISKLKSSWSQNNRFKSKPIPASNTQKMSFPINANDLEVENSTFKLAVHCLINSQLLSGLAEKYKKSIPFSCFPHFFATPSTTLVNAGNMF